MKIALLFVLMATLLALSYGAPAALEAEKEAAEAVEAVAADDDTTAKNKRNLIALGYGYAPLGYASPYAYAPAYTYPSAYSAYTYPYAAYSYGGAYYVG